MFLVKAVPHVLSQGWHLLPKTGPVLTYSTQILSQHLQRKVEDSLVITTVKVVASAAVLFPLIVLKFIYDTVFPQVLPVVTSSPSLLKQPFVLSLPFLAGGLSYLPWRFFSKKSIHSISLPAPVFQNPSIAQSTQLSLPFPDIWPKCPISSHVPVPKNHSFSSAISFLANHKVVVGLVALGALGYLYLQSKRPKKFTEKDRAHVFAYVQQQTSLQTETYYPKRETGLPWGLSLDRAHTPVVHLPKSYGVLGRGAHKIIKNALSLAKRGSSEDVPLASVSDSCKNAPLEREISGLTQVRNLPGFVHAISAPMHYAEEKKCRLLEPRYDGTLGDALHSFGRLWKDPFSFDQRREICKQLLTAITSLHNLDKIHRDLRPENIFLQKGPPVSVAIGDLELLAQTGDPSARIEGSIGYSSPERVALWNSRDSTQIATTNIPSCDVYALGCIFAELFGIFPPWRRLSHTSDNVSEETLKKIQTSQQDFWTHLSETKPLESLLKGMLHPDPTRRISARKALQKLETIS